MPTKNDATGTSVTVEYNGDTYTVPPADEWDIDVLEELDVNHITVGLRKLLGDEQYTKFRATNRKIRSIGEFFEAAGRAVGAPNS